MDKKHFLKIAVTVDYHFPDEAQEIEKCLTEKGFDFVHIRKPQQSTGSVESLIASIDPDLRPRITVHDHFPLAVKYGLGGIHLNRRNPLPPDGWNGRISASCHSFDECGGFMFADYVTLSPIFPSISKPGYRGDFDTTTLSEFLNGGERPPVGALGGVRESDIDYLRKIGFEGAAMLADAWRKKFRPESFNLQFITHPNSKDDAVSQARTALQGGCRWIQLRWKVASDNDILEASSEISELCREHDAIFLLDDRVHIVKEARADGVHLGKNDMPVEEARKIIGPGAIIGKTANTPEDLVEGVLEGADYIGMGPYRFTTTKRNLSPILGLEGYRKGIEALKERNMSIPIVAIGGITEGDIPQLLSTGVDGIALSGYIINSPDPKATTGKLCNLISHEKQNSEK